MLTAQTKPSIAAVSAIESIAFVLAQSALHVERKRHKAEDFATKSAGADTGTGKKANATNAERLNTERGRMRLSPRWVVNASNAASRIFGALILTISTEARSLGRSIGATLPVSALPYGSAKWETCKYCARTVIASRRGPNSTLSEIACERIENAQRQERLFA